jgi:pyruvate formate lyase activating enzyme
MHEALLWKPLKETTVRCELCNQYCAIKDGERGKCGVRENHGGTLYTLVYDKIAAVNMDPVEKKPLYHFMPGTQTFSIGTMGCNISCTFCQNFSLSQPPKEGSAVRGETLTPQQLVEGAQKAGAKSISYTYSEPTIFFELVLDTAKLAIENDLRNVIVSNGFMTRECLEMLGPVVHAANIDLKAFTDEFYKQQCDARLKPVLENLKQVKHELGWWLEVTTLVIPGLNDKEAELDDMAGFIANELGVEVPWHLSRFHPDYKLLDRPVTPVETLERAFQAGKRAGLKYIYVGNLPGHDFNSTRCPECEAMLVNRRGFMGRREKLAGEKCAMCGAKIEGIDLDLLS